MCAVAKCNSLTNVLDHHLSGQRAFTSNKGVGIDTWHGNIKCLPAIRSTYADRGWSLLWNSKQGSVRSSTFYLVVVVVVVGGGGGGKVSIMHGY